MRPVYSRNMPDLATYWPPGQNDGFGSRVITGASAVLVQCRWQDQAVLFRDTQGREVTSSTVVYLDRDVEPGGYLAAGDYTAGSVAGGPSGVDPRAVQGAQEIRQIAVSPSLSGDEKLVKVFL